MEREQAQRYTEIKNDYSEIEIIKDIVEEKLNKLKGIEPKHAKRKVYGYLLRRGFTPETIMDVLCSPAN